MPQTLSSSNYSNASSYTSIDSTDKYCPSWLKTATKLNPIVVAGQFQVGNPYLDQDSLRTDSRYKVTETHLKVFNYEKYFNAKLKRVQQVKKDLKLSPRLANILFSNLTSFEMLSDSFLNQIQVIFQKQTSVSILTGLINHHFKNFLVCYQDFMYNYRDLQIGFHKLKKAHWKQMKSLELEDELFQYPIQYLKYYKFLAQEFQLELPLNWGSLLIPDAPNLDVKFWLQRFITDLSLIHELRVVLALPSPFEVYLVRVQDLVSHCRLLTESIYDPRTRMTPNTEKFFNNSNKSVYDLMQVKIDAQLSRVKLGWEVLSLKLGRLAMLLSPIQELLQEIQYLNKSNKLKNFKQSVELERRLNERLPRVVKVIEDFVGWFRRLFEWYSILVVHSLGEESEHNYDQIIEIHRQNLQFEKMSLLQLYQQKQKVLKYNYRSVVNDTVPLSCETSFVINRIFQSQ